MSTSAPDPMVPLYVDGETELAPLAAILRANGFALRSDTKGRMIAEPVSRGLFNLVVRDDLPAALPIIGVPNAG
jgi:hypothetical protein